MLTNIARAAHNEEMGFVHNYYERLVLEEVFRQSSRVRTGDRDFMSDVSCVALNRLPPRYIRHDVDMTFFMSPQEMQETELKINNAVSIALNYVESRERGESVELPPLNTSLSTPSSHEGKNSQTKVNNKKHKR